MITDTHAHYDDEAFNGDREELFEKLRASGVGRIINSGADLKTSRSSTALAQKYDFIYAAVGIHPDNAGEADETAMEELKTLARTGRVAAIGEIGLDYHWNVFPHEVQKSAFIRQWELADELGLPIVIHSRDAAADTMDIIRDRHAKLTAAGRPMRADLHCYSYSREQAEEYVRLGLYFGVGGVVTFKNARKLCETVDMLPLNRILLETDCPYLAPEPFRGQRNNSGYISYVAEKIAEIKGISPEEVIKITTANADSFFALPPV